MDMNDKGKRPPAPEDVASLFVLLGEAVWYLQHLEGALSTAIAIKLDLADAPLMSLSAERASDILAKRRRLTLGKAVALTKSNALFDSLVTQRLEKLLDERNWLVHRLVHQNGDGMNADGDRDTLLRRIDNITDQACDLQKVIGADLMTFVVAKGVNRDAIESMARRAFLEGRGLADS